MVNETYEVFPDEIDALATAIVQKLGTNLYKMPEEFWNSVIQGSYLTVPVSIPCDNPVWGHYLFQIWIHGKDRAMEFRLCSPDGSILKRFGFI